MAIKTKEMNPDHPRQVITPTPGWIKKKTQIGKIIRFFRSAVSKLKKKDLINGKI